MVATRWRSRALARSNGAAGRRDDEVKDDDDPNFAMCSKSSTKYSLSAPTPAYEGSSATGSNEPMGKNRWTNTDNELRAFLVSHPNFVLNLDDMEN